MNVSLIGFLKNVGAPASPINGNQIIKQFHAIRENNLWILALLTTTVCVLNVLLFCLFH